MVPSHRRHIEKVLGRRAIAEFGLPRNIPPEEALYEELQRTAGLIQFYESRVRELSEDELTGPIGSEGVSKESGVEYHPKAEAHIYIRLHQAERDHFVKIAKACIDAGIEKRRVELAERQGALIATVIGRFIERVGLDPKDAKVRAIVREELTSLTLDDDQVEELE